MFDYKTIFLNKFSIGALIAVIIFLFISFKFGTYHPQSALVDKLVTERIDIEKEKLKKDLTVLKEKYEADMKLLEQQNEQLNKRLISTNKNYAEAQKEMERLKKVRINYVPPKSIKEAQNRLNKFGYITF